MPAHIEGMPTTPVYDQADALNLMIATTRDRLLELVEHFPCTEVEVIASAARTSGFYRFSDEFIEAHNELVPHPDPHQD